MSIELGKENKWVKLLRPDVRPGSIWKAMPNETMVLPTFRIRYLTSGWEHLSLLEIAERGAASLDEVYSVPETIVAGDMFMVVEILDYEREADVGLPQTWYYTRVIYKERVGDLICLKCRHWTSRALRLAG